MSNRVSLLVVKNGKWKNGKSSYMSHVYYLRSFTLLVFKVSHPCWKYISSRAIVHLRQTRLAQANYMFQCTRQNEKKKKARASRFF